MKLLLKHLISKIGNGLLVGVGIILSIGIFFIVYAAGWSVMTPVGTGSGLSANSWNQMIDNLNDLNSRINNFTFNSGNVGIGVTPTSKLQVNGDIKSLNTPKAWVAFNGETLAIYASYNVSSITRATNVGGAGAYKINFTNSLPDINYAVMGSCNAWGYNGDSFTVEGNAISGNVSQGLFTNYAQIGCRVSSTNISMDSNYVTAIIYDN